MVGVRRLYKLRGFFNENKAWMTSWSAIAVVVMLTIWFWPQGPSPVPSSIRSQASFTIIYPKGYDIDSKNWKYLTNTQVVQFTAGKDKYKVVFTEEETPLEYQDDAAAYNRFVGSLRPKANFDVSLGTVTIVNFVTAGDYEVVGETGMLNTHGVLLLAHPDTQLSDNQWRALFSSLKLDR